MGQWTSGWYGTGPTTGLTTRNPASRHQDPDRRGRVFATRGHWHTRRSDRADSPFFSDSAFQRKTGVSPPFVTFEMSPLHQ